VGLPATDLRVALPELAKSMCPTRATVSATVRQRGTRDRRAPRAHSISRARAESRRSFVGTQRPIRATNYRRPRHKP
jgi:hypothetical protein